jgi:hypothetical protein
MPRDIVWKVTGWILMAIASLSIHSQEVVGQCADERMEPPGAVVHGKTIGEWTAACWQWLAGIPDDGSHPLLDLDGASCAREQDEAVFFLPGSLIIFVVDGKPFPRDQCVVPCGKPILLGLSWAMMWAPGDCEPESMQDCVALAASSLDSVTPVEATVDGIPLPCPEDHREVSPVFDFSLPPPPESNIFALEEPLTRKGVSDGHWILLKPLPPGKHTILLRTVWAGEELPLLYELTVGPCDGASFRRGDADGDQIVGLTDALATLEHLLGGAALPCDDAADSDDSGVLDLTDAVHTLNHLFLGGQAPPAPGPDECGADPTEADDLSCGKGC